MGLTHAKLILKNPRQPELPPLEVEALADSEALFLCIPQHVQAQLELEELAKKDVTFSDGRKQHLPYVGPVELRFKNRVACVGAIVVGDEVLLGSIPMEDMDVVIVPKTRSLEVNPDHPNFAAWIVK